MAVQACQLEFGTLASHKKPDLADYIFKPKSRDAEMGGFLKLIGRQV